MLGVFSALGPSLKGFKEQGMSKSKLDSNDGCRGFELFLSNISGCIRIIDLQSPPPKVLAPGRLTGGTIFPHYLAKANRP